MILKRAVNQLTSRKKELVPHCIYLNGTMTEQENVSIVIACNCLEQFVLRFMLVCFRFCANRSALQRVCPKIPKMGVKLIGDESPD